jgi:hypothetical protein
MKGNPTAGILLLLLASLLISIGLTNKGKQIINILLNREGTSGTSTTDEKTKESPKPTESGGYSKEFPAPSLAKYPGTFVGEKGAKVIL